MACHAAALRAGGRHCGDRPVRSRGDPGDHAQPVRPAPPDADHGLLGGGCRRGRDMAVRPSLNRCAGIGLGLLAAACQLASPPQLVRDGAGIFSADARAAAESRLRAIAGQHGVWTFVLTEVDGDPPRMLDAPMGEADALGVRAVAILFDADQMVGAGYSRASVEHGDSVLEPPGIGAQIQDGGADVALERVVEYLESWAADPPPAPPAGERPPLEAPSRSP